MYGLSRKGKIVITGALLIGAFLMIGKKALKQIDKINERNAHYSNHIEFPGLYVCVVKPALDKIISLGGLIFLFPFMLGISILVWADDPGPVFFIQERFGKDKSIFFLHKYRTMKMNTPHDVPTHLLGDPEQYITRVGRFLRKTSLDELPQLWDIFRGRMSVVGPRPALWNQYDLVKERGKYDANGVLPGLTGLAQISGRDELEIPEKARLDGKYVAILRKGGMKAFAQDVRLLFSTVAKVLRHDGVVEGGTGALRRDPGDAGFDEYGHLKRFKIDTSRHIRVLITGAESYIGESFKNYVQKYYTNIECDTLDIKESGWREFNFKTKHNETYDAVFHVAGIAHADVGAVSPKRRKEYYDINEKLAIETAAKAREAGVSQFIYMSSMIVYGGAEYVDEYTMPAPVNAYGDSKWKGDVGVRRLSADDFHVAVLRAPMIYGKDSKGNYSTLSKFAKMIPVFPEIENKRSMLYIENLCEFVSLLTLSGSGGIYFPQNKEYSKTTDMVSSIAAANGVHMSRKKFLNPVVHIACKTPGRIGRLAKKAFGNCCYSQKLSHYEGLDYAKVAFIESIRRSETFV